MVFSIRLYAWLIITATLPIAACAARPRVFDSGVVAAIRIARHELDDALKRRDFSAYVQITSDRVSVSGPAWRTVGREELKEALSRLASKRPDLQETHITTEVRGYGNWEVAYESGEWREIWRESDGVTEITGKYSGLWRLDAGRWVLDAEVFVPLNCKGSSYCN
jgi:ketosteroid isomerase-like protein